MNINTYLAGPITNPQDEVIGIMTILCKRKVEFDTLNNTLFGLFLSRINSEIERLINLRKLEFLASIPQQNPNPIIRILLNGDVVFTNDEGKIILNYWIKLFKGLPVELLKEAQRIQKSNQSTRIEMEIEDKIYLFTLVWIDEFKQINIYGTDITQLKNTQNAMLNLTRRDTLTQIANRQYFEEKLIEKIYEHHLKEKSLALLLIDLDNFKIVNDTLGHPTGDKLLMAVTNRMTRCLRANDFIARLGGDEFIVLLDQCNTDTAVKVAEKIINVLGKPFQFDDYHMTITASIGIAIYPETSEIAKVDQRLLIGIEGKIKLRKLLSGIINLTKDLNIKIIQKGIETAEQHEVIKSLGCQYAQGYFYCKPVALNDLLPLIKKTIH